MDLLHRQETPLTRFYFASPYVARRSHSQTFPYGLPVCLIFYIDEATLRFGVLNGSNRYFQSAPRSDFLSKVP